MEKPSSRDNRKSTRLLVYPKFQLPLLAVNLSVICTVSLIIWVQMSNAISDLQPVAGASGFEVDFYRSYLNYQAREFQYSLLTALAAGILLSTLLTLLVSHRFSGPMIRLKNYFRGICESRRASYPLEFRGGDYLSDLPPLINEALNALEQEKAATKPEKKAG